MLQNCEEMRLGKTNIIGNVILSISIYFCATCGKCNDAVESYANYVCFVLVIAQEHTDGEGCGCSEITRKEARLDTFVSRF